MVAEKHYDLFWKRKKFGSIKQRTGFNNLVTFGFIENKSKVLDLGCGEGHLASMLIESKNCKVTGIDISKEAVRRASMKGVDAFVLNIEEDWPFKRKEFDYIVALDVLEHLFNPAEILSKIHKSSKYAIFNMPNAHWWKCRMWALAGKTPRGGVFGEGMHLWHWGYLDFKKLIRSKNFEIIDERLLAKMPVIGRFFSDEFNESVIMNFFPNLFVYGLCIKAKSIK